MNALGIILKFKPVSDLALGMGEIRVIGIVNVFVFERTHETPGDAILAQTYDSCDDVANRLLSVGSTSYLYNGTGQRMQQTVGSTVTQYLLDTQPGLAKVLQSTTGSNIIRYVHGLMGIQEQQNPDATWRHPIQDGLGSVRTVVDTTNTPQESRWYDPYGNEIQQSGSQQTVFGFTGEETDSNGLVNLWARYYNPTLGQFMGLDPLEGDTGSPMSLNRYAYVQGNPINDAVGEPDGLNRYSYVNGNPVNLVDPSGMCAQPTQWWNPIDANCFYSADGLARRFSNGDATAYQSWFDVLIQKSWGELKGIETLGTLNDASILPSLALHEDPRIVLQALQQFGCQISSGGAQNIGASTVLGARLNNSGSSEAPPPSGNAALALVAIATGIVAGVGLLLGFNALSRQVATSGIIEYRLTGFDEKVGTLAEHLAKLLEHNVAGFPPSYPNPNRGPDRGWCNTVRRVIQEIDDAGYSDKQLTRDLAEAGVSPSNWNSIRDAVLEVVKKGLCNDYWGGFGGGSLAR